VLLEKEIANPSLLFTQVYGVPDVEPVRQYYTSFHKDLFTQRNNTSIDLEVAIGDMPYDGIEAPKKRISRRQILKQKSMESGSRWNPFRWLFPDSAPRPTSISTARHFSALYAPKTDLLSQKAISELDVDEDIDDNKLGDGERTSLFRSNWILNRHMRLSEVSSVQSSEISDFINNIDSVLEDDEEALNNTNNDFHGNGKAAIAMQAQMPKAAYEAIRLVKVFVHF
jgi:hypothetical protein